MKFMTPKKRSTLSDTKLWTSILLDEFLKKYDAVEAHQIKLKAAVAGYRLPSSQGKLIVR